MNYGVYWHLVVFFFILFRLNISLYGIINSILISEVDVYEYTTSRRVERAL